MKVRRSQLKDTVTVDTRTGEGAYGPTYAAPRDVQCDVDETRRMVRDSNGDEAVSEATLICHPRTWVTVDDTTLMVDPLEVFTPESTVTIAGRTSRVLAAKERKIRGYAVLVEVTCA